jgi:formylmethanofuran dehydrogenase subunit E
MPLLTLPEYEKRAAQAHGHLCAGQILGIRLAVHGLHLLGIDDPTGADRKRLIVYVEIDRCATDAIAVVTGCRVGKRALKLVDYGKLAATFCDLRDGRAVRVSALESSRNLARERYPGIASKNEQQMRAYRELLDAELFAHTWVRVEIPEQDLPGYKAPRVVCAICGEAVSFGRQVGNICRACAGKRYYQPL